MATESKQSQTPLAGSLGVHERYKQFDYRLGVVIAAGAYALAGGAVTLLGWALDSPRLTDWANTGISMFANTAVCASLSGLALLLLFGNDANQRSRVTVRILANFVALIGGLTLFEHVSGLNLGIDTLLFDRPFGQRAAAAPMRMGPPASTSFLLLGAGLLLATYGQSSRRVASALATIPVAISSISLIGFWFGADQLYTVVHLTGIAVQTSTMIAAIGIGLMASIPEHGFVSLLCRDDAGGMLVRKLVLPIIAIPLFLGWFRLLGEKAGLYDTGFGVSVLLVTIIALLLAFLWLTANRISRAARATKDSRDRLEAVLKQAPVAIGVIDASGAMMMANDLMRRYVAGRITSQGGERTNRWRAIDDQGVSIAPDEWPSAKALRGEQTAEMDLLCTLDDGQAMWVRSSAAPLLDDAGKVVGAIEIIEDIDARKRAEEALTEADHRKNEFLATLAHELRNPLAPIRNSLHILRTNPIDELAARDLREMMERQVNHMVRLVDDLLEVSRIESGKIELRTEQVAIADVLRNAIETSMPLIEASGNHFDMTVPSEQLIVEADPVRLSQVVANLLNNAAKYTEPGGKIWLAASSQNGDVSISVRDTGIGISPAMLPQIFRMFAQADRDHKRAQGGLGIGLALAKSLIEMHGGRIDAFSEGEGCGSEFRIRLPLVKRQLPIVNNAASGGLKDSPSTRSRVLVVDDNQDAASSLAVLLRMQGNDVRTANSGPAALEAIESFEPSVVLLDLGMPGMSGYEVAQRAQGMPAGKEAVLVALTGWGQEEDRRRTTEAGFNHHLVKPVEADVLKVLLAEIQAKRQLVK